MGATDDEGDSANADTSGFKVFTGKGEAAAWFFLMDRDATVENSAFKPAMAAPATSPR